jgi:hypothetical protein
MPLFEAAHLAKRFDLAIMSSKGVSVTAARHLADQIMISTSLGFQSAKQSAQTRVAIRSRTKSAS